MSNLSKITHHKEYYLRGADLHFLVDLHLFRVHSYFFDRDSSYFRQRLVSGTPAGEERIGSSDRTPFVLEDVKSEEFVRFLWVFYNPRYSLYETTLDEWTTILRLAVLWDFIEVKKLAVRFLETLTIPPIDKISIYERFGVHKSYLAASYATIIAREEPLAVEEGKALGLETALMLAAAREKLRPDQKVDQHSPQVDAVVREMFGITHTSAYSIPVPSETPNFNGHSRMSNGNASSASSMARPTKPTATASTLSKSRPSPPPKAPSPVTAKSPTSSRFSNPPPPSKGSASKKTNNPTTRHDYFEPSNVNTGSTTGSNFEMSLTPLLSSGLFVATRPAEVGPQHHTSATSNSVPEDPFSSNAAEHDNSARELPGAFGRFEEDSNGLIERKDATVTSSESESKSTEGSWDEQPSKTALVDLADSRQSNRGQTALAPESVRPEGIEDTTSNVQNALQTVGYEYEAFTSKTGEDSRIKERKVISDLSNETEDINNSTVPPTHQESKSQDDANESHNPSNENSGTGEIKATEESGETDDEGKTDSQKKEKNEKNEKNKKNKKSKNKK